jgi:hypothetical protein
VEITHFVHSLRFGVFLVSPQYLYKGARNVDKIVALFSQILFQENRRRQFHHHFHIDSQRPIRKPLPAAIKTLVLFSYIDFSLSTTFLTF